MYLDFAAAIILIICIIRGEKRGVIETFASAFGWIFSLFFTMAYSPVLAQYLTENTPLKGIVSDFTMTQVRSMVKEAAGTTGSAAASDLPAIIADALANAASGRLEEIARPVADSLADTFISVLAFVLMMFVVKLILRFFEKLIKKLHKAKTVGTVDGILGMAFGVIKGAAIVYFLMAVLILAASLTAYEPLIEVLQTSVAVDTFNSHNLLFFGNDIVQGITIPGSEG